MTLSQLSNPQLSVSKMAANLIPSEIIKLGQEVGARIKKGEQIANLTIGDFDPKLFPIPKLLENLIVEAYREGQTNYPAANGIPELRLALTDFLHQRLNIDLEPDEILISGGARPLIYALYQTIVDPGDKVIYAVPSWNNNHYCHLCGAEAIELEVGPDKNFMPQKEDIVPHIKEAVLLALCSPQNPTGTTFSSQNLQDICNMVVEENLRRSKDKKPLYIMYDQIYWQLTFGENQHHHPLEVVPGIKEYVVYIDGVSKCFAATGVRVGWAFGPRNIIDKMRATLSHIGAWAPKAEQWATARFLNDPSAIADYLDWFKPEVEERLRSLYEGLFRLQNKGYPVEVISPQAAIYLTVRFPWIGMSTANGDELQNMKKVASYLIDTCGIAIVPFNAFGASDESEWFRISVGTLAKDEIPQILSHLENGLKQLQKI